MNTYSQTLDHKDSVRYRMAISKKLGINTDQDYHKAGAMFMSLGKKGYADAWYQLGLMYKNGLGCEKNEKRAYNCFRKGNKLGSQMCAISLAQMLRSSNSKNKNYDKAFIMADSMTRIGAKQAFYQAGEMSLKGIGTQQSYTKAIEYFAKGAELREKGCLYMLGICYTEGNGVSQNIELAKKYFAEALVEGHPWVEDIIERNSIDSAITIVANQIEDLEPKVITDNIDISTFEGHQYWKGTLNIYDWSGRYIRRQRPISVQISAEIGNKCHVYWKFMNETSYEFNITKEGTNWIVNEFLPNTLPKSKEVFTGLSMTMKNNGSIRGYLNRQSLITGDPKQPVSFVLSEITEEEFNKEASNICISRVYPNPARDNLRVYFSLRTEDRLSLAIFNANGMLVKRINAEQYNEGENVLVVNMAGLKRGNYVLSIEGTKVKSSITIMKED